MTALALVIALGFAAAPTEEGDVLWRAANLKLAAESPELAKPLLQRLIARHPGHSSFTEAHRLLGTVNLLLGNSHEAKAPLRYYVQAMGKSDEAHRARLELASAELQTGNLQEALLLTHEIDRHGKQSSLKPSLRILNSLMKARILRRLGRRKDAERALTSASREISAGSTTLRSDATVIELELKIDECAQLPGAGASKLDEAQTLAAFDRRGQCLSESIIVFRSLLGLGDEVGAEQGAKLVSDSHARFSQACSHPSAPTGKRSAKEIAHYLTELTSILRKACRAQFDVNLELLQAIKGDIPAPMLQYRDRAVANLRKSRSS